MIYEEDLQLSLDFFRRKISETIDQAIEMANAKFNDYARTCFEVALSYKKSIWEIEEELEKIKKKNDEDYKRILHEDIEEYREENLFY